MLEDCPAGIVGTGESHDAFDELAGLVRPDDEALAPQLDDDRLPQATLPGPHRPGDDLDHAAVALEGGEGGPFGGARACRAGIERRGRGEGDGVLAEGGQHLFDVAEEDGVRADEQHPLSFEAQPMAEQQVGGPVEGDGRLARAGTSLHHERAGQFRPYDGVLLGLDRGDDVGHPACSGALETGDESTLSHEHEALAACPLPLEELVVETCEAASSEEEVAPSCNVERLCRRRAVEGLRDWGPPVDHEWVAPLVGDADPPDVEALVVTGHVEASEADRAVSDAKLGEAALGQLDTHVPLDAVGEGPAGSQREHLARDGPGRLAHGVETFVRAVDVRLFGRNLGVAHDGAPPASARAYMGLQRYRQPDCPVSGAASSDSGRRPAAGRWMH